eukprot:5123247-Ditylum_brightwellii.AAC.1
MEAYMIMLGKWEQEIIENSEILVPLDELIEFMKQGKCIIATDSSADDDIILFAWKVGDVGVNAYFCHVGSAFDQESNFRTEAYGI